MGTGTVCACWLLGAAVVAPCAGAVPARQEPTAIEVDTEPAATPGNADVRKPQATDERAASLAGCPVVSPWGERRTASPAAATRWGVLIIEAQRSAERPGAPRPRRGNGSPGGLRGPCQAAPGAGGERGTCSGRQQMHKARRGAQSPREGGPCRTAKRLRPPPGRQVVR